MGFEVCGEGGDTGLEGVDFLLMTFCLVTEGSLDLRLDTIYVRRDFCGFAGLGVFLVHVILDLLLQGRLLLFCIMKRLFQSLSLETSVMTMNRDTSFWYCSTARSFSSIVSRN